MLSFHCNKNVSANLNKNKSNPTPIQKLISLSKSSCFGKCPVYTITVYEDGLVILESNANIEKLGVFYLMLNALEFSNLNKKIHSINWSNYKTSYMRNIPDLPITTLNYYNHQDSSYAFIKSNYTLPGEIEDIQSELNQLAYKKSMIQALKDKEVHDLNIIKNELQIDMDSTLTFQSLEELFSPYEFKMTKRISEFMNFYLFRYNSEKISPYEMVVLSRKIKGIRLVTFNKKLNPRDEF